MGRIVDLSLLIEDNMPAHKLFQRPIYTVHMSHESAKAHNLGVPGDAMTFQTNFIGMVDHVGTHVDAFRHVSPNGLSVDEMPLDLFMGKAVCFDLRHIPDLGEITVADMDAAEAKCGVKVDGHIVLLCTGFHKRNYPSLDSVWKNPLLTVEATRWLHTRGSRMHGVEGPSTDKPTDKFSPSIVFAAISAFRTGNGSSILRSCSARASFSSSARRSNSRAVRARQCARSPSSTHDGKVSV